MLKKSNLKAMEKSITLSKLSKTVQQAMDATLRMGFLYLLVDYLYIIQDCKADWKQEATHIDQIYANASCTIAATGATDGTEGLYFDRNKHLVMPQKILTNVQGKPAEYFMLDYSLWYNDVARAPLNERAWVLQEMTMSPRIVHFARNQVYWTCDAGGSCETFPSSIPLFESEVATSQNHRYFRTIRTRKAQMDEHELAVASRPPNFFEEIMNRDIPYVHERVRDKIGTAASRSKYVTWRRYPDVRLILWKQFVEDYSSRKLTNCDDRTVAIQDLANEMATEFNKKYVAGLWNAGLPFELLWKARDKSSARSFPPIAPSWSWLSLNGPVEYADTEGTPYPKVKVSDVTITREHSDSGALIFRGFIRLHGRLARASVIRFSDDPEQTFQFQLQFEDKSLFPENTRVFPPMLSFDCPAQSKNITEVYVLQLTGYGEFYDTNTTIGAGLLLEKINPGPQFVRCGRFDVISDPLILATLVRACDNFDKSPFSDTLKSEMCKSAKLFDITLL